MVMVRQQAVGDERKLQFREIFSELAEYEEVIVLRAENRLSMRAVIADVVKMAGCVRWAARSARQT